MIADVSEESVVVDFNHPYPGVLFTSKYASKASNPRNCIDGYCTRQSPRLLCWC
ncbi:MAG: hypothetical protein CM15mP74_20810 [Halieaceae bacterium]|nr:MAG: hypothetical protein CM15mP74_20810 [Halieaceae bacterium]